MNPNVLPAVHPGSVLLEELIERDWAPSHLANLLGQTLQFTQDLLRSDEVVTPGLATDLERATGISASFWVNLQSSYDRKTTPPVETPESATAGTRD